VNEEQKMRIVLPDDWNQHASEFGLLQRLQALGEVAVYDQPPDDRAELIERLRPAEALVMIQDRTPLDRDLLRELPHLRLISLNANRYSHVDADAATDQGVVVCINPGHSPRSVAELSFALLLAATRHVAKADRAVHRGDWSDKWATLRGRDLGHRTLGILGLGRIGPYVAKFANGFEMRVLAWSANMTSERAAACGATLVPLDQLLRESDAVSIHLQLSSRTRGLLGRRELELMKPGAVLVNTSRAEIVDEAALIDALRTGRLSAGLDVFWQEPLPTDHPLLELDNVALTPHYASTTEETARRRLEGAVENVAAYAGGEPTHVVNPTVLGNASTSEATKELAH
jgi:phosphoglycerate dehydrogenase-like enzyme